MSTAVSDRNGIGHDYAGMRCVAILVLAAGCAARPTPAARPQPPTLLAQLEASRDLDGVVVGTSDAPATVAIVMASWCGHCRRQLRVFDALRASHPHVRWLGVGYKAHEEYDRRGDTAALRALAAETPWLRVIPAGDEVFAALGRPPLIPTIFVFDRTGALVARFDRRERRPPGEDELTQLLRSLP